LLTRGLLTRRRNRSRYQGEPDSEQIETFVSTHQPAISLIYRLQSIELKYEKQLASRPVTYLLGELDVLPLAGFDSSCPAMAQGPTRLARGQAFAAYVKAKYNAQHQVVVVPLCGHNARCMFTAEVALPILFPKV
jgi:hypothetical protein